MNSNLENYNIYLDWKIINERRKKICIFHKIILTKSLLENKKNLLFSFNYEYFNKNRIIDSYYQPNMILKRLLCERVNHNLENNKKDKDIEKNNEKIKKKNNENKNITEIII